MSREVSASDVAATLASVAGRGVALKVFAIGTLVLLGALMITGVVTTGVSAAGGTASCQIGSAAMGTNIIATDDAQGLARTATEVANEMNMPGRAVLVILMAGFQESTMRNLDYGDRDSLGWLQQRPSQGWGTAEQVMDPAHAATMFYTHLRAVPGWLTMAPGDAAQAVQVSGFPDAYAKWQTAAADLASQVGADLSRAGDAYGDGQTLAGVTTDTGEACGVGAPLTGTAATTPENATICPDPTTGRGCITPRTGAFVTALKASGLAVPSLRCWDAHSWNPTSDHPKGRACDAAISSGFPNADQAARGEAIATWTIDNAAALGVHYVIWSGQIWTAKKGWRPYDGAGIYDVGDASGGHYDHVHISVY